MNEAWDTIQKRAVNEVLAAFRRGERKVILQGPTGCGKTKMAEMYIEDRVALKHRVAVYANRNMLIEQLSKTLGVDHGVRGAGYDDERDFPVQICKVASEHARRGKQNLHQADDVLIDECHMQRGEMMISIMNSHYEAGANILGLSATPLGLEGVYDTMVCAATNSELRACGALVPAIHYAPDEPFFRRPPPEGEDISERVASDAMGFSEAARGSKVSTEKRRAGLIGRVWSHFERLNPERRPTILFGPSVAGSLWFAEQFQTRGVSSAHIDSERIWINGEVHKNDENTRGHLLADFKAGDIKVLCNRFILREGIDAPWVSHGIFATVFGGLGTYLQAGGRFLRSYPGLESVTIQDHGGNFWRHGSLNADRAWKLEFTNRIVAGLRAEDMREKRTPQPGVCPKCFMVIHGRRCRCGWEAGEKWVKSRPVVTADGTLREQQGDIWRPRRRKDNEDFRKKWEAIVKYRGPKTDKTFRQYEVIFARENYWWYPCHDWPYMPIHELDWFRRIKDVPIERLRQPSAAAAFA